MNINEIIDRLKSCEILEDSQCKVYKFLLKTFPKGPLRASYIANQLDMNRTFVYEVLDKLFSNKLVDISKTNPKKYSARHPNVFLKIQIKNRQRQLNEMLSLEKICRETLDLAPRVHYESPSTCGMYFPPTKKRY